MSRDLARLLLPALRWNDPDGAMGVRRVIERGLDIGVGGFILFGGEAEQVKRTIDDIRSAAPYPMLIGSDLERGAGQQFRGATPLPPAAALGSLADSEAVLRAAEITAREARALGVNWVFGPVADIDLEPRNPIIGTRAFSREPERVAADVVAWIRGCRAGGALSCAKHFPGHGRTTGDSHAERPSVGADRAALDIDLHPFRQAIDAGVDALMTAHVSYPALDPSNEPATLSSAILNGLLRTKLGFEGLVVTDALIMEGALEGASEGEAAVRAVAAGCDLLLYPEDLDEVMDELQSARGGGYLSRRRIHESLDRIEAALDGLGDPPSAEYGADEDRRWSVQTAMRSLVTVRGQPALPGDPVHLVTIDDDVGGPYPPFPRGELPRALREAGVDLDTGGGPIVAVYADIRAWKGRPGLSEQARRAVGEVLGRDSDAPVLLFAHPRLADELPDARHVLGAWGGEAVMQAAVAARLTEREDALAPVTAGMGR